MSSNKEHYSPYTLRNNFCTFQNRNRIHLFEGTSRVPRGSSMRDDLRGSGLRSQSSSSPLQTKRHPGSPHAPTHVLLHPIWAQFRPRSALNIRFLDRSSPVPLALSSRPSGPENRHPPNLSCNFPETLLSTGRKETGSLKPQGSIG